MDQQKQSDQQEGGIRHNQGQDRKGDAGGQHQRNRQGLHADTTGQTDSPGKQNNPGQPDKLANQLQSTGSGK